MEARIIKTSLVHEGFVRIEKDQFQFERFGGGMSPTIERFRYSRGDAVAVIVFDESRERILLIRQFRNAVHARTGNGWLLECPAGMMEAGETPASVAFREVKEETGLVLDRIEPLTSYFFSPGGCSDQVHLFLGIPKKADPSLGIHGLWEEGEEISSEWVPLDQALQMIWEKQIVDAKAIIGILMLCWRQRN